MVGRGGMSFDDLARMAREAKALMATRVADGMTVGGYEADAGRVSISGYGGLPKGPCTLSRSDPGFLRKLADFTGSYAREFDLGAFFEVRPVNKGKSVNVDVVDFEGGPRESRRLPNAPMTPAVAEGISFHMW